MDRMDPGPGIPLLAPDEACVMRLRALFDRRGFLRTSVGKFEDYALYLDNKNFLGTEHVITFMDVSGRLLALKPDVTLSVVKNTPAGEMGLSKKLYYIDEVYRLSPEHRSYQVLGQIGVELIGPRSDSFADLEVLDLALACLSEIGGSYALDVSHLGFVSALLAEAALPHETETQIIANIHAKNVHDVTRLLDEAGAEDDCKRRIVALAGLHGPIGDALPQARELVRGGAMAAAFEELERLGAVIAGNGAHVNLDFSVVNDLDYYNALIFRGYLDGVPSVVLNGGRYDNLMTKMGKESGAIGFAVWLDRIAPYLNRLHGGESFDVLLLYPDDADWGGLLREMHRLEREGLRVRCEREGADLSGANFGYARHMIYSGNKAREAEPC